jgi:hypothetical protein
MTNWTSPPKPEKRVYEYTVHPYEDRYEFRSSFSPSAAHWLAEEAAEDFFSEHDGWECAWPLAFRVFDGDVDLGLWSVDMESRPHFMATELVTA